jgi:hypothetical protein
MKLVSAKEILYRLKANINIVDIDELYIYNWMFEALRDMNTASSYILREVSLDVEDYVLTLPCDYAKMWGVYYNDQRVAEAIPSPDKIESLTYYREGDILKFTKSNITIELMYYSLSIDTNGIPYIPDVELVKQAIFWYVMKWIWYKEWSSGGDAERRYRDADMNWKNYRSLAVNQAKLPSIAEMKGHAETIVKRSTLNSSAYTSSNGLPSEIFSVI